MSSFGVANWVAPIATLSTYMLVIVSTVNDIRSYQLYTIEASEGQHQGWMDKQRHLTDLTIGLETGHIGAFLQISDELSDDQVRTIDRAIREAGSLPDDDFGELENWSILLWISTVLGKLFDLEVLGDYCPSESKEEGFDYADMVQRIEQQFAVVPNGGPGAMTIVPIDAVPATL